MHLCQFFACLFTQIAVLTMALSADELERTYGSQLSDGPLSQCPSFHFLHKALVAKRINVTQAAVRVWWKKYRLSLGAPSIQSAKDLHEYHGPAIMPLVTESHPRLCLSNNSCLVIVLYSLHWYMQV